MAQSSQLKPSIILDAPADWELWLVCLKTYATALDVWEFVNLESQQRIDLVEPPMPTEDTVTAAIMEERRAAARESAVPQQGQSQEQAITAALAAVRRPALRTVQARLLVEEKRNDREYQTYLNRKQSMGQMVIWIHSTIHQRHLQHTYEKPSVITLK